MRFFAVRATLLCLCIFLFYLVSLSQENSLSPSGVSLPVYFGKSSPLKDLQIIKVEPDSADGKAGLIVNVNRLAGENTAFGNFGLDPALQNSFPAKERGGIIRNFEGVGNLQYKLPPDTEGDVGKNHYIQMINMSFAVFDKTGNMLYGPAPNLSLWQEAPAPWSSFSNGDPIVLYDEQADRWLLSELSFPYHPNGPYYFKIAISATADPLGSWFLYGYEYDYFCDYPKIAVWHDGYYLTTNNNEWVNSQWDFHAVGISVFERDSMLSGSPSARRIFYDFYPNQQPWSMLPADFDGSPPHDNTPARLAYLREGATDRIFIYKAVTDWQNIANSSVGYMNTLFPAPFDDQLPDGISQPDNAPYLDPMTNRLMYRLQYRLFDDYECMVTNHTVNRGDQVAAIRWYEFRNYGSGWEIHQQGTYSPDGVHRWMGSAAMDGYGNIAVGYSVSGDTVYPSIRYSGQTTGAPSGILDVAESMIIDGSGVQTNPYHRWGDYSAMSVDPVDQTTFWYTQQYYEITGDRSWQTRIASFHINDYLTLAVNAAEDTLCQGNSTQLSATVGGGSGNYSFLWRSSDGGFNSVEQNPVVSPQVSTLYICLAEDGVTSKSDSIAVVVNPEPLVEAGPDTIICSNQIFEITEANVNHYAGVFWKTSGDGTFDRPDILHPVYAPGAEDILAGNALLSLNALPLSGCDGKSDSLNLIIDPCTGTGSDHWSDQHIEIYPNPAGKVLNVRFAEKIPDEFTLRFYSLSGQLIETRMYDGYGKRRDFTVDLSGSDKGVYLLHIQAGDKAFSFRVLIFN